MRTLRLAFPLVLTLTGFAACGGGGLVPSDAGGPGSGGATGSGAAPSGSGGEAPGSGGDGLGGDNLGGAGGMTPATGGSETGTGGSGPTCAPRVHLLIQRSGAMFDFPSMEDNWWDAVGDALDGEGGLLEEFGAEMELSASIFTKVADEACPLATSVPAPIGAGDLGDVLASEAEDFFALRDAETQVDAPVVEAVEAATEVLADDEDAYIVLIISGIPDSCEENNMHCTSEDVFTAVQAAHAEGIQTRLVYLSSDNIQLYPEGVANAGAGMGIQDVSLGCASGFEYSETPGDAPFAQPEDVGAVEAALEGVLSDIAACN